MDELLLFTLTSSYYSHGRALTTAYLTSSSQQLYLTSTYYLHGRVLTTVYLMSSSQQLYSTAHADEPPSTVPKDELHSPPSIDDLSRKQDTQLKNQDNTRKSDDEGHRPNPTSPTSSNHTVGEPSQSKQNSIQYFNDAI